VDRSHRLFSKGSEKYAASRPRYPRALFEHLSNICPDHEIAWDCGTGSGQAAMGLATKFRFVEATDVSPEQILNAPSHEQICYSVQAAESTSFARHYFSLVAAAQALHWFDHGKFWPEVHRVLKPGGIFAAWTYTWPHVSKEIDSIIKARLRNVIENYWAPQNRLAWDGYASINFPFQEVVLPDVTMKLDWNLDQFLSYLGTWSATRRCIEDIGTAFFEELGADLESVWGVREQERGVKMEFHCRVGRHVI
jgi:SAM-dependent methyltransferase